jgi:hypothetical protein
MKNKLTLGDIICYPVIFNPFYLLIIVAITCMSLFMDLFTAEIIDQEKFVKLNLTKGRIMILEFFEAILVGVVNLYFWDDLLAFEYVEYLTRNLYPEKYPNRKLRKNPLKDRK